jgi:hypothetical protein
MISVAEYVTMRAEDDCCERTAACQDKVVTKC